MARVDPKFPQWMTYLTGFLLFLNAGNARPADLEANWGGKSGPISIVNQAPIQLLFLQAAPDKAETLPKGQGSLSLNTTTTNTLLSESSGNYEGVVDMEMIRASLDLKYGILQGFEIGVSLPFVYSYSGFMDNAILDVERFFFDNTRTVRVHQEADKYEYYVTR